MEYLYHGSTTQGLKTLEPQKRYTPAGKIDYAAIYATPLPGFAAAHAFPWSSDDGIDLDVIDGKVILTIPETQKYRLAVPISVYKLPAGAFEHTKEESSGYTWHTTESVDVLSEEKYTSVEEAFEELGVEVDYLDK